MELKIDSARVLNAAKTYPEAKKALADLFPEVISVELEVGMLFKGISSGSVFVYTSDKTFIRVISGDIIRAGRILDDHIGGHEYKSVADAENLHCIKRIRGSLKFVPEE